MSAKDDARDLNELLKVILKEPMSLTQRMALSTIQAMLLKRAVEVDELRARLERKLVVLQGGARP